YIVIKEGKVGTIDIHNNIVIPIIYDGLSGWVEYGPDAHFVKNKGKYGLISHEGKIIIPIEYDYVDIPLAGVIRVRRNGKYGVISWKNEEILPCIYDNLINDIPYSDLEEQEGKLAVLQNEIWSYYDLKGNLIRKNIPIEEIMGNYGNRFAWGEPSNEKDDFDIHQANKNY
ncbi:WG repeat-containing protein, partial [Bacteroides sp.]